MIELKFDILSFMNLPCFPMTWEDIRQHFIELDEETLEDAIEDLSELGYIDSVGTHKKPMYLIAQLGLEVLKKSELQE